VKVRAYGKRLIEELWVRTWEGEKGGKRIIKEKKSDREEANEKERIEN
jgi:hypothetical protein